MNFMLDISLPSPAKQIGLSDKIMLIGSCFTEHISGRLANLKFPILQNPNGILFDPLSVCKSLETYMDQRVYSKEELCYLNELWHSWDHHSQFSGMDASEVLEKINGSIAVAHQFLQQADFLIITLGSAFSYQLAENSKPVANCHRAPAQWFHKKLSSPDHISTTLTNTIERLKEFNPSLEIVFTISPVRHIRDGVVENNRSKARLIEVVHTLVERYSNLSYFPAYELVIDVLRDYRFYDIDLVHPNYAATEFVFEKFLAQFFKQEEFPVLEELKNIITAFKHKPFQPNTRAHQAFLQTYLEKIKKFKRVNPKIMLDDEEAYFAMHSQNKGTP